MVQLLDRVDLESSIILILLFGSAGVLGAALACCGVLLSPLPHGTRGDRTRKVPTEKRKAPTNQAARSQCHSTSIPNGSCQANESALVPTDAQVISLANDGMHSQATIPVAEDIPAQGSQNLSLPCTGAAMFLPDGPRSQWVNPATTSPFPLNGSSASMAAVSSAPHQSPNVSPVRCSRTPLEARIDSGSTSDHEGTGLTNVHGVLPSFSPSVEAERAAVAATQDVSDIQQEFIAAAALLSPAELQDFVDAHVAGELAAIRLLPKNQRASAFRALAAEWHPDRCPAIQRLATQTFQKIMAAKNSILQSP